MEYGYFFSFHESAISINILYNYYNIILFKRIFNYYLIELDNILYSIGLLISQRIGSGRLTNNNYLLVITHSHIAFESILHGDFGQDVLEFVSDLARSHFITSNSFS